LAIAGLDSFTSKSLEIAYGKDSKALSENRIARTQVLSGTGGLRVLGEFLKYHGPNKDKTVVHLSKPTWGNHFKIFEYAGLKTNT